jgi:hypothetical protein
MADYQAHINQAKKNLVILSSISQRVDQSWDWQVTCAYYVAVHLMNAHIAKSANLHYKTHEKVKNALYDSLSPCKIPDDIYTSYVKLENLSRRARYLCHDDPETAVDAAHAFFTYDKHLKKAIIQLDKLLNYFSNLYNENLGSTEINCIEIKSLSLSNFKYKQVVFV